MDEDDFRYEVGSAARLIAERMEWIATNLAQLDSTLRKLMAEPKPVIDARSGSRKYDWAKFEAEGKLFHACNVADRPQVARSLSAGGIQRYGPGEVRTKTVGAGVWIFRKGVK